MQNQSLDIPPQLSPSQPDQTEVSWQSIFWALVPLALNIMVQPTGQALGLPKRYAMLLRSSPIVCVVDCAVALVALIWYKWRGSSISSAVHQLMESRFQGSMGAIVRDNSLSALLQNPWLRLFVFVGGTLPQTIKLFGLQGVPWAKALASMYLIPFLLFELITFIERRNQDQGLPQHSSLAQQLDQGLPLDGRLAQQPIHPDVLIPVARISGCLAIAVQIGLWFILWHMIFVAIAYQTRAEGYQPSAKETRNMLNFFLVLILVKLFLLKPVPINPRTAIPQFFHIDATPAVQSAIEHTQAIWYLASLITLSIFLYVAFGANGYVRALCEHVMRPIWVVCVWTTISFLLFLLVSTRGSLELNRLSELSTCHWLAWHFLGSNVVFAYFYYVLAWDPHGTGAPGWTTYLG